MCCAGPLLTVLGSVGATSAIASLWVPGLGVLTVAAAFGIVVIRRRRRTAQCPPTRHADLGLPSVGAVRDETTSPPV
ncbi:MAG: hypothetical protein J2P27_01480 [Actinobacteria bacterium]|nr:hypothetical protein [Actinomycetota bacterium]